MLIFIKIFIAHILTDFFLQPKSWIENKRKRVWKSGYLYLHVFLTGAVAWLFLWDIAAWSVVLFIVSTHFLIDAGKLMLGNDNLGSFLIDQALHILVIAIASLYLTSSFAEITSFVHQHLTTQNLTFIAGYLVISTPAGFLVGKATRKWQEELIQNKTELDSLKNAGIWIGILERVLVLTFVVFDQFSSIGFLIAAKSILRFSDKNETNPRKQTEYVLIGTLISFSIAILTGILVKWVLQVM